MTAPDYKRLAQYAIAAARIQAALAALDRAMHLPTLDERRAALWTRYADSAARWRQETQKKEQK